MSEPGRPPEVGHARPPHLSFRMKHRLGALEIDAAFALTQPWTLLFGPSGSGKSTILRTMAGLLRPDSAKIVLHLAGREQVVVDTDRRIFIPPHHRSIRWAAQYPVLFPHKTVRQNLQVASRGASSSQNQAADLALEHFRLTSLASSMPATLSGGEQHRVALARAAVAAASITEGCLLIFDEPFTGLDAPLRDELLDRLRAWPALARTPVLSVTHDLSEAFLLQAEIVRLHEGRVLQQGPVADVLAAERARLLDQLR